MIKKWMLLFACTGAFAQVQEVRVRHARDWRPNASDGWCAIKVWVDDEAEFALSGETLRIATTAGQEARDVASECSTPLPQNVENFSFRGIDGRGDVQLLEEPSRRNRWSAVVRIKDRKGGGEEYHFRFEFGRGSVFSPGGGRSTGTRIAPGGSSSDASRMRTGELRREIERRWENRARRLPSVDIVDEYIDRVRFDRWTLDQVLADIDRRAR